MACPKFDRTNKKHVIIAASVAASIVILIVIIVLVVVLVPGSDSSGSSDSGNSTGSGSGTGLGSESGSASRSGSGSGHEKGAGVDDSDDDDGEDGGWREAVLEAHNEIRRKHHADPLKLSSDLNKKAQKCAKYYAEEVGDIDHSCRFKENAGENLHQSIGRVPAHVKPKDKQAIYGLERMYREVHNFDFSNPYNNKLWNTGHFTQMVWKGSKELGLGVHFKKYDGYSVYLYRPRGNDGNYDSSNVEKE